MSLFSVVVVTHFAMAMALAYIRNIFSQTEGEKRTTNILNDTLWILWWQFYDQLPRQECPQAQKKKTTTNHWTMPDITIYIHGSMGDNAGLTTFLTSPDIMNVSELLSVSIQFPKSLVVRGSICDRHSTNTQRRCLEDYDVDDFDAPKMRQTSIVGDAMFSATDMNIEWV